MSGEIPPMGEHAELQLLLGAYALDATDPEESALVERHLQSCVRCAAEVARHHEVAGLLANTGGEAPEHLWEAIAGRLAGGEPPSWDRLATRLGAEARAGRAAGGSPPDPERVVLLAAARTTRRRAVLARAGPVAAAAAAVVAVVLGLQVVRLHHELGTSALDRAERAALAQPSSIRVKLGPTSPAAHDRSATLVLTPGGTGFVEASGLPSLPAGRTYQLWGISGGQAVSLGLLGPAPKVVPFTAAGHGRIATFAVTAERAGGVVASSGTPVVEGSVSS